MGSFAMLDVGNAAPVADTAARVTPPGSASAGSRSTGFGAVLASLVPADGSDEAAPSDGGQADESGADDTGASALPLLSVLPTLLLTRGPAPSADGGRKVEDTDSTTADAESDETGSPALVVHAVLPQPAVGLGLPTPALAVPPARVADQAQGATVRAGLTVVDDRPAASPSKVPPAFYEPPAIAEPPVGERLVKVSEGETEESEADGRAELRETHQDDAGTGRPVEREVPATNIPRSQTNTLIAEPLDPKPPVVANEPPANTKRAAETSPSLAASDAQATNRARPENDALIRVAAKPEAPPTQGQPSTAPRPEKRAIVAQLAAGATVDSEALDGAPRSSQPVVAAKARSFETPPALAVGLASTAVETPAERVVDAGVELRPRAFDGDAPLVGAPVESSSPRHGAAHESGGGEDRHASGSADGAPGYLGGVGGPTPSGRIGGGEFLRLVDAAGADVEALTRDVERQIVSAVQMQWKQGVGEARVELHPEHLGAMTVSLKVEDGAVTATVQAESADVQAWVMRHAQDLRDALGEAGLQLQQLVVTADGERKREADAEPQGERNARRRGRRRDLGSRFEVRA
ncbi:MAG: flagellar hook-length control protein FliK [Vicinamibacterales bacterium]